MLQPLRKNVTQTARVLPDGRLDIAGVTYDSLSAAAKGVTGTVAGAGWDFWGAPSGAGGFIPLARLRDRLRDSGSDGGSQKKTPNTETTHMKQSGSGKAPALAATAAAHPGLFPLAIFADYRGEHIDATVETTGAIRLGPETFRSPSMAAVAARKEHGYAGWAKRQRTAGCSGGSPTPTVSPSR